MPVARRLVLTYGSFSTDDGLYRLDGPIRIRKDRKTFEVATRIVVAGTSIGTDAGLVDACADLEASFRLERQDLTLELGASKRLELREGLEAYDLEPEATQPGTIPGDTERSAVYEVSVRGKLPEPIAARNGLADLAWTLDVDPGCRGRLRISGLYTRDPAVPATGSRAAYEAGIDARTAAVLALVGGAWQRVDTSTTTDLNDDETSFAISYVELLLTGSGLDNPDLSDTTLAVTRRLEAPGDVGADVRRLRRLSGAFATAVCKDGGTTLDEAVQTGVSALLAAMTGLAIGPVAVVALDSDKDEAASRVSVRMEAISTGGASTISRRVTTTDELRSNAAILDTWTSTGNAEGYDPGTAFVFPSPVTIERTLTIEDETLGESAPGGPATPAPVAGPGAGGGASGFGFGFGRPFRGGTAAAAAAQPFGFGFGAIQRNGFVTTPPRAGAGAGGASGSSGAGGGGGGQAAAVAPGGGNGRAGVTQQSPAASSGPEWVFLRASPTWSAPEVRGLPGLGTPLQVTRSACSTTWRLVRREGAAAGGLVTQRRS